MSVKAGVEKKTFLSKDKHYRPQGRNVRSDKAEYDACFFEVILDDAILDKWWPEKLNLKVTKKSGKINTYIYMGKSRLGATKPLKSGNA